MLIGRKGESRKAMRITLNDDCKLTLRQQALFTCNNGLRNAQTTNSIFRRHAHDRGVMLIGSQVIPLYSQTCWNIIVIVIGESGRIGQCKMYILINAITVYMRMRKRRHALQKCEQHEQ